MLCRIKDKFEYLVASQETANDILDRLGFGKEKCAQTYDKGQRYGYCDDQSIKYGFKDKMYGTIEFGRYVVFDFWLDDCNRYAVYHENEFKEDFEKCEEIMALL